MTTLNTTTAAVGGNVGGYKRHHDHQDARSENRPRKDAKVKISDTSLDMFVAPEDEKSIAKKSAGIAKQEYTLNVMTGDISVNVLRAVPGVSPMALHDKENAGEVSAFRGKNYKASSYSIQSQDVSFMNLAATVAVTANNQKLVGRRISNLSNRKQCELEAMVKIQRFLALKKHTEDQR